VLSCVYVINRPFVCVCVYRPAAPLGRMWASSSAAAKLWNTLFTSACPLFYSEIC
jgi:hypothetical protein